MLLKTKGYLKNVDFGGVLDTYRERYVPRGRAEFAFDLPNDVDVLAAIELAGHNGIILETFIDLPDAGAEWKKRARKAEKELAELKEAIGKVVKGAK